MSEDVERNVRDRGSQAVFRPPLSRVFAGPGGQKMEYGLMQLFCVDVPKVMPGLVPPTGRMEKGTWTSEGGDG